VEGSDFSYVEEIYEYYIFCGLVAVLPSVAVVCTHCLHKAIGGLGQGSSLVSIYMLTAFER
jgi:hypothetical protein